jgi:prepilin-type N-terminal cleavage/methylation domain-containing protein
LSINKFEIKDYGFTLIELLVSIFVFAIILTLSIAIYGAYSAIFSNVNADDAQQNTVQNLVNDFDTYVREAVPCPTYGGVTYNTVQSAGPTTLSISDVISPSKATVYVVTFNYNASTDTVTADASPCPGQSGQKFELINQNYITSLQFTYYTTDAYFNSTAPTANSLPNTGVVSSGSTTSTFTLNLNNTVAIGITVSSKQPLSNKAFTLSDTAYILV